MQKYVGQRVASQNRRRVLGHDNDFTPWAMLELGLENGWLTWTAAIYHASQCPLEARDSTGWQAIKLSLMKCSTSTVCSHAQPPPQCRQMLVV
jgi:hypothetical protein